MVGFNLMLNAVLVVMLGETAYTRGEGVTET